jgi:hypothetical protein
MGIFDLAFSHIQGNGWAINSFLLVVKWWDGAHV